MLVRKKRVFILTESNSGMGWEFLQGIMSYVRSHQDWIIDCEDHRTFDPIPKKMLNDRWDGIIFRSIMTPTKGLLQKQMRYPCPTVELLGDYKGTEVRGDALACLTMAIEHAVSCHFSRIAFYSNFNVMWLEIRRNILTELCRQHQIECYLSPDLQKELLIQPTYDFSQTDEQTLLDWLPTLPKPILVAGIFDKHGIQIINACKKLSFEIPRDVAVVAFGNNQLLCETISPTLSSVDIASFQIGYESARLLNMKMNGQPLPELPVIVAPTCLVQRESTPAAQVKDKEIAQAITMIRDNAVFGLTVRDIQNQLQIAPRTLERGIKKALGRTPKAEIVRIRLEHAVRLLDTSDSSVSEIARLCGFPTRMSFIESFKELYNATPMEYRKKRRPE